VNRNVTVLTSILETPVSGEPDEAFSVVGYDLGGEPYARAIIAAVAADYHGITARPDPTGQDLLALVQRDVTLTVLTENGFGALSIEAIQGRVSRSEHDQFVLLDEESHDVRQVLNPDRVLDVEPGYGHLEMMCQRVKQVLASLPAVDELTEDHLLALPQRSPREAQIGVFAFGTWRADPGSSPGAIWMLHSYDRDDDIAVGLLILRPWDGVRQHGPVYGRRLLADAGRIINPPSASLTTARDLCDLPYHEALARFASTPTR